ncbi:hypothetical protein [Streptomyces sp. NBC_01361]|nr:hypothetical protein [Streptomyces sp. NBC_01361]
MPDAKTVLTLILFARNPRSEAFGNGGLLSLYLNPQHLQHT